MAKQKTYAVLVRTNCEYSLEVEVRALDMDDAGEKAVTKAEKIPYAQWNQAWAPFEAEQEGGTEVRG